MGNTINTFKNKKLTQANNNFDDHYKVIIIGNKNIGKSSFLSKMIDNGFLSDIESTIGIEILTKQIGKIKLQFWDKSNKTTYEIINKIFYKNAKFIILTFSLDNRQSFENINYWLNNMEHYNVFPNMSANKSAKIIEFPKIILLGTKHDMSSGDISEEEIILLKNKIRLKYEIDCEYFFTSILENNQEEIIKYIIKHIISSYHNHISNTTI